MGRINAITVGDSRDLSGLFSENTFHQVITSPPYYNLRDYGSEGQVGYKQTLDQYVKDLSGIFQGAQYATRPDGTLWLNIGDTYNHNRKRQAEDSKRKVGVSIPMTSESQKGLKPKDMIGVPWRVAMALQGFSVIPACSLLEWADTLSEARDKGDWEAVEMVEAQIRASAMFDNAQDYGWYLRSAIIWQKTNGLPGSYKDRPTSSYEIVFMFSKSPKYHFDWVALLEDREDGSVRRSMRGVSSDNKYMSADDEAAVHQYMSLHGKLDESDGAKEVLIQRQKRDVWSLPTANFKGDHHAPFPEALVEMCLKAGCPEVVCADCGQPYEVLSELVTVKTVGVYELKKRVKSGHSKSCNCQTDQTEAGIVLDPFLGSGTVARVAIENRRRWAGVEINPEYATITNDRINGVQVRMF